MTYDHPPHEIVLKLRDRKITVADLVRAVGGTIGDKVTHRNARNHAVATWSTAPWVGFQDIERTDTAPWRIDLNFEDGHVLTFAHLQALSNLCGTRKINVIYCREDETDPGEYTPGDPSRFMIRIEEDR